MSLDSHRDSHHANPFPNRTPKNALSRPRRRSGSPTVRPWEPRWNYEDLRKFAEQVRIHTTPNEVGSRPTLGGYQWSPRPNSQSMEGLRVGGDAIQIQIERIVMDWDQTLYGVRALQSGSRLGPGRARARPAQLLDGKAEVTPFVDRDAELEKLTQWYDSTDRVSVMLVHGSGGQGKTRLMRQFAENIRKRDNQPMTYEAVSLTEIHVQEVPDAAAQADTGSTLGEILLVVDEADVWPTRKLLKLFGETVTWGSGHVRILLAARTAGWWWMNLCIKLAPSEIRCHDPLQLRPLSLDDMRELAQAASSSLSKAMGRGNPPTLPQEIWDQLRDCPPLSVELMVLGRVLADVAGEPMPEDLRAATEVVLQKEIRYWEGMYGLEGGGADRDLSRIDRQLQSMARAVYVATLAGSVGYYEAQRVIRLARMGDSVDPQQIIQDHARCYPAEDVGFYLAPLPPFLAEEFLGLLIRDPGHEPHMVVPDDWAVDTPFHVLGLKAPGEPDAEAFTGQNTEARTEPPVPLQYPWLARMMLRLVRAADKYPHLADKQLYPLALNYPEVMILAGKDACTEFVDVLQPPEEVLTALEEATHAIDPDDLTYYRAAMEDLQFAAEHSGSSSADER